MKVYPDNSDRINSTLSRLIQDELSRANNILNLPQFQSRHEAYAVLKEEFEEAMQEINDLGAGIEVDYWKACRYDKEPEHDKHNTLKLLMCMEAATICGIKELIQTAAMIRKAKLFEERKLMDNE